MKLKDVGPLVFRASDLADYDTDAEMVYISDAWLDYDEAIALRDWLNRVLDSYPAREGYVMIPKIPTVAMRIPWHRQGGLRHASFYQKWKAMLAAALAAQEKP